MASCFPPPEVVDDERPSQCRTRRFPDDDLLRRRGFSIHARPRGGPAVWKRGDEYLIVTTAVLVALAEEATIRERSR